MSTFNGKVKSARAVNKGTGEREYQTIIIIEGTDNKEVDSVKVTYPDNIGPGTNPTTCVFADEINFDRHYKDTSVKFGSVVAGQIVEVVVVMLDCEGTELKTEKEVKLSFY